MPVHGLHFTRLTSRVRPLVTLLTNVNSRPNNLRHSTSYNKLNFWLLANPPASLHLDPLKFEHSQVNLVPTTY